MKASEPRHRVNDAEALTTTSLIGGMTMANSKSTSGPQGVWMSARFRRGVAGIETRVTYSRPVAQKRPILPGQAAVRAQLRVIEGGAR